MKIGFDYIATIGGGGNQIYSRNIINNLALIDEDNKYYLYGFLHDYILRRYKIKSKSSNFKFSPSFYSKLKFPISEKYIKYLNKKSLQTITKIHGIDVFHFSNPLNFIPGVKNSVVTIHDLSIFHNPEWAKKSSLDFFQKNMKNILNECKHIISVSDFTKRDIIKFYGIDENKITVIHEAASDEYYYEEAKNYLKDKYGLDKYIFYTGQLQPRKNILRLLEAYSLLDIELRNEFKLVLAGSARNKEFLGNIKREIENLKIENNVEILGYVNLSDLRKLYSQAKFFVYPSLFEGFGLPILESFKCETPVVASDTSSMPEVAGSAAISVNPKNVNDISQAMRTLFKDKYEYKKLKSNCKIQAEKFSWQKAARQTLEVYDEVFKAF